MTNEQKDNLTGLCRIEIKRWKAASESNPDMRYMVELMEVALATLNAQPVKQPGTKCIGWVKESIQEHDAKWRDAIRAAGYEVQE